MDTCQLLTACLFGASLKYRDLQKALWEEGGLHHWDYVNLYYTETIMRGKYSEQQGEKYTTRRQAPTPARGEAAEDQRENLCNESLLLFRFPVKYVSWDGESRLREVPWLPRLPDF